MGSFLYKLPYIDAILFRLRVSSALGDEFHIDLYFIAVQCIVLIFLKFLTPCFALFLSWSYSCLKKYM